MSLVRISLLLISLQLAACAPAPQGEKTPAAQGPAPVAAAPADAAERVNRVAKAFVDGYYAHYPEEVYEVGYPDAPSDRFGDHSTQATAAWQAEVDGWLAELDGIDVDALAGTPAALTYAFARDRLQALVDRRVCRLELWNVSPTWTGWQYMFASTLAQQAVATAADREAALSRLADIARYLETEVSNLRRGQDLGYTAGQNNVDAVLAKTTSLIDLPAADSPFFSPAARAGDDAFAARYEEILQGRVRDAMIAYRDFLRDDYEGHAGPGVGENPDGSACYAALVRYYSSVDMDARDIHQLGIEQMARIQSEMLQIARDTFDTDDLPALLSEMRTNPEYTFNSEQHQLDYIAAAVARGKEAVGDWFGHVPDAEMIIVASPPYDKDSGGGFYSAGTADGSRPGIYTVGTYEPTGIPIAGQEATAFHESYPGHHLQVAAALGNESAHPILRYMFVSGFVEGWGLYAERLADEMGIYSSQLARLGMLSNEAYRAARMVVDPGMHVMGWTREEAVQYMLEHTAESRIGVNDEIDRYSAVPGQATSYMIGSLEIQRLRQRAEEALGKRFDIREFHDRVIAQGGVTLPIVAADIEAWIEDTGNETAADSLKPTP